MVVVMTCSSREENLVTESVNTSSGCPLKRPHSSVVARERITELYLKKVRDTKISDSQIIMTCTSNGSILLLLESGRLILVQITSLH